jgi:hypothetical protein
MERWYMCAWRVRGGCLAGWPGVETMRWMCYVEVGIFVASGIRIPFENAI